MPNPNEPRLVLAVRAWPELRAAYENWSRSGVEIQLKARLDTLPDRDLAIQFRVVALPSNAPIPQGLDISAAEFRETLVFGIVMSSAAAAEALAKNVRAFGPEASIGADLPVSVTHFWSHWCSDEAAYGLFGDRAAALRTMRAAPGVLAAGEQYVNIVFVDTGLPPVLLPAAGLRGWDVLADPENPASAVRHPGNPLTPHGEMVARNALAIARPAANPRVRALDCPVIPDGITDLPVFLNSVTAALYFVLASIVRLRALEPQQPRISWVICNAWGVFDPTLELPEVPYANNPEHPLAVALRRLQNQCADIVFAAGNCGAFCPNDRCHPDYTGPGCSINGANALEQVLTVGAVRTDKLWLGYSGQGPGIAGMVDEKPDLCAPSQFENDGDAGPNTGTSAACGLAAGAVALLRTRWQCSNALGPAALRAVLRNTAVQPYGPDGWQCRTGYGILDLASAADRLNHPDEPL